MLSILDDARFASSGGNRQPWKVAIVEDRALRRELAVLMQPVWDEYLEPFGADSAPFNAVDWTAAGIDHLGQTERIAERDRVRPRRVGRRRRPAQGRPDGRSARPPGDDRRRLDLPVLLEPAAVRPRPRVGRRDDDVPQPRRARRRARRSACPPHHALGGDDLPRRARAPADQATRNPVESFTTIDRFDGPPACSNPTCDSVRFGSGPTNRVQLTVRRDEPGSLIGSGGTGRVATAASIAARTSATYSPTASGPPLHQPPDDASALDHAVGDLRAACVGLRGVRTRRRPRAPAFGDRLQPTRPSAVAVAASDARSPVTPSSPTE